MRKSICWIVLALFISLTSALAGEHTTSLEDDREIIQILLQGFVLKLPSLNEPAPPESRITVSSEMITPAFPKGKIRVANNDLITVDGHVLPYDLMTNMKSRSGRPSLVGSLGLNLPSFTVETIDYNHRRLPIVQLSLPGYTNDQKWAGVYVYITSTPWGFQEDAYFVLFRHAASSWEIDWSELIHHRYIPATRG